MKRATVQSSADAPGRPAVAAEALKRLSPLRPSFAVVLGSGLRTVGDAVKDAVECPYSDLPGFVQTAVAGHAGRVLLGRLADTPILLLNGRVHFYEGYSLAQVTFPIRVLKEFGIKDLLLTNAAGAIDPRLRPGDFMLIADHINWLPENPLRGVRASGLSNFVDLTQLYDVQLRSLLRRAARRLRMRLREGVYLAISGPSYETPAEIRAFARLGADAVGMSTVPEAIVARQCGLRVAGISCITNLAAGLSRQGLGHREVLESGRHAAPAMQRLLQEFIRGRGRGGCPD